MNTIARSRAWAALALAALAGCSGRYPVSGTVEYAGGEPFAARGRMIARPADPGNSVSVVGDIDEGGRFLLYTLDPGDGVLPGRYRVAIVPNASRPGEPPARSPHLDARFTEFDTSGLEIEVGPRANRVTLTVTRPAKAPKPQPPEE